MILGCYNLRLYCETEGRCPSGLGLSGRAYEDGCEFTGRTRAQASRAARNAGWALTHPCERYPEGRVRCPGCKKAKR